MANARQGYNANILDLDKASKCLDDIASAQTMMEWRTSVEG